MSSKQIKYKGKVYTRVDASNNDYDKVITLGKKVISTLNSLKSTAKQLEQAVSKAELDNVNIDRRLNDILEDVKTEYVEMAQDYKE